VTRRKKRGGKNWSEWLPVVRGVVVVEA
jgi:hypothetical protein